VDIAIQVVSARWDGDDRAEALPRGTGHLLVLADGAGGTSGGAAAADAVLARARSLALSSLSDCVGFLRDLDRQLTNVGQTTAIVVVLEDGQVFGASVGDSCAWLLSAASVVDLTRYQKSKPLLGSGNATPIGFGPLPCSGRVLVGSDGLFKYVTYERICNLASSLPLTEVPAALVAAARLRSGALQDDIAVIVAG
jgi:serine/threonine protein phosphatase PrpC